MGGEDRRSFRRVAREAEAEAERRREEALEEKYAVKTNVNDIPYEEDTHSYMQHSIEKQKHSLMRDALHYGQILKAQDIDIKEQSRTFIGVASSRPKTGSQSTISKNRLAASSQGFGIQQPVLRQALKTPQKTGPGFYAKS